MVRILSVEEGKQSIRIEIEPTEQPTSFMAYMFPAKPKAVHLPPFHKMKCRRYTQKNLALKSLHSVKYDDDLAEPIVMVLDDIDMSEYWCFLAVLPDVTTLVYSTSMKELQKASSSFKKLEVAFSEYSLGITLSFEELLGLVMMKDEKTSDARHHIVIDYLSQFQNIWAPPLICTNINCLGKSAFLCTKCQHPICSLNCLSTHTMGKHCLCIK